MTQRDTDSPGRAAKRPSRRRDYDKLGVVVGALALLVAGVSMFADVFGSPLLDTGTAAPGTSPRATGETPGASTAPAGGTPAATSAVPAAGADPGRLLSTLGDLPSEFVFTTAGVLRLQCPTGRSGDTERSATVALPGPYQALQATVRGAGQVDPEAGVQLEVLAGFRQELADRVELRGRVVTTVEQPPRALDAKLAGAARLVLRWRCADRDAVIEVDRPRLVG